ncbi:hypothetical protein CALCODRAFT_516581 [Calocera cornea HHB12733]|uniref:Uncharacterized protein n=1 Tax=Calocera cornea HHB12733 TaxID=1353952 RepID=A0A165GYH7_9BASI|nr:hypothetical protein CALCODRAFT_516581 [Calocera cornea HHB12733]
MPPLPRATSILDYAQRAISTGLLGLTLYGVYGMVSVHESTMKAGQEALARRQKEQELMAAQIAVEDDKILARAEAAQVASKPANPE